MAAIDALQSLKRDLIRKATNGSVFYAQASAPTILEADLFDPTTGDIRASGLPTGYGDMGMTTDAGAQFARSITTSEVSSWQSKTPSRSDITADSTTMQVSAQETKLANIGLYIGIDPAAVSAGLNGVVRIDVPDTIPDRYYRVLAVAVDETTLGEIILARFMPNAKVTNFDGQNFAKGDDAIGYPVTFTGYKDDTLGFSQSYIFGGAGWKARLAAMGFSTIAVVPVVGQLSQTSLPVAGGTTVRIVGRGFTGVTGATGVKFAGTNATSYNVWSDNEITAVAPAHTAGTGQVTVTNVTGSSTTGPTVTYS